MLLHSHTTYTHTILIINEDNTDTHDWSYIKLVVKKNGKNRIKKIDKLKNTPQHEDELIY